MFELRTILVPTDFSPTSLRVLDPAAELARRFGAQLRVLYVLEPPVYPALALGAGAVSLPALQGVESEMRSVAETNLARLTQDPRLVGLTVKTVLREGTPAHEILAAAKEEEVGLIVMATHGRTGIKHLLLGSTTEKVVRRASCPVLTIREPEEG